MHRVARLQPVPDIPSLPLIAPFQALFVNRLDALATFGRRAGDIGRGRIGPRAVILVNSPALVQALLVERAADFHKGPAFRLFFKPVVGNGLLTSEESFHREQRKLIAPAFQHRRVADYADVMAACAESAQAIWQDGTTIDLGAEMTRLTLDIVGKTLFGSDVVGDAAAIGNAMTTILHYASFQIRLPFRVPMEWNLPGTAPVRQAFSTLNAAIYRLIDQRRQSGEDRGDLLSMLLMAQHEEDGSRMTDQQVRDEAMTLFLAGHETTANAMTWAWYLLAHHPDCHAKLCTEVDAILQGRTPTYDDLPKLPYTLQVFKEALRLYPPAYLFSRQAIRDTALDGYGIRQQEIVILSPYLLHRRPDCFPDPEAFQPKRFTPEAEKALPRAAYIPFGGGPRICIGNQFALMEGHLLLATIAQKVTLQLAPGQKIRPDPLITLRPHPAVRMVVHRRNPSGV